MYKRKRILSLTLSPKALWFLNIKKGPHNRGKPGSGVKYQAPCSKNKGLFSFKEIVMKNYLELCKEVKNNRDFLDVYSHLKGEVKELEAEVANLYAGHDAGEDGVTGEAVDVILCALDLISITNPNLSWEELQEVMEKKYNKWKRIYGADKNGQI